MTPPKPHFTLHNPKTGVALFLVAAMALFGHGSFSPAWPITSWPGSQELPVPGMHCSLGLSTYPKLEYTVGKRAGGAQQPEALTLSLQLRLARSVELGARCGRLGGMGSQWNGRLHLQLGMLRLRVGTTATWRKDRE